MVLIEQQLSAVGYDYIKNEIKLSNVKVEMSIDKKEYHQCLKKDKKYSLMLKMLKCIPFPTFKYDRKVNNYIFNRIHKNFKLKNFKKIRDDLLKVKNDQLYDAFIKRYKEKLIEGFGKDIIKKEKKKDLEDFFIHSLNYNKNIKKKVRKIYCHIYNTNDDLYQMLVKKKKIDHIFQAIICPLKIFENLGDMNYQKKYKKCIILEINMNKYKQNYILVNSTTVLLINNFNFKNIKIKDINLSKDIKFKVIECDMY